MYPGLLISTALLVTPRPHSLSLFNVSRMDRANGSDVNLVPTFNILSRGLPAAAPPAAARSEKESLQTSRPEVARTFSRDEPILMPEKVNFKELPRKIKVGSGRCTWIKQK